MFALGAVQKKPIQDVSGDIRMMNSLESKDLKLPMKRQKGSEEKLPKLRLMRGKRLELSPRRKKERLTD